MLPQTLLRALLMVVLNMFLVHCGFGLGSQSLECSQALDMGPVAATGANHWPALSWGIVRDLEAMAMF